MDKKRVKQAENNFKRYLKEILITKSEFNEIVFKTYLNNSLESLKVADEIFKHKLSPLWCVVSSYYSMFYIACAYIYRKGYKTKHEIVHQIISETLIVLANQDLKKHFFEEFEEEKDKVLSASGNLLDSYEYEKTKRSQFQYETTGEIKESKAKTSLERAKKFVAIMRQLI